MMLDNTLEAFSFRWTKPLSKTSHTVQEDYIDQHNEDRGDDQACMHLQLHPNY